jgi:predicted MFS family arabinose efflux permease
VRPDPDSAARRRRVDIVSLGIVIGFAWTLVCLLLTGGSELTALAIALLWLAGIGAVAAMTTLVLRIRTDRRSRYSQPRRRNQR